MKGGIYSLYANSGSVFVIAFSGSDARSRIYEFKNQTFFEIDITQFGDVDVAQWIYEDSMGHLWFATRETLLEYDNGNLREHNLNITTRSSNYINAIREDEFGNIWIATREEGLSFYDRTTTFFYTPTNSDLLSLDCLDILITNNEELWISYGTGLTKMTFAEAIVDDDGDGFTSDVDCDDNNDAVYPGAQELCDGIDNNCDSQVDESVAFNAFYLDSDGDGYGNPLVSMEACENFVSGYVTNSDDCDDGNLNVNPDANDIPNNGIDEDCDGVDLLSATHELASTKIKIYPNPVTDIVNVDVDGSLDYMVSLFDLQGRSIKAELNASQIQVGYLSTGIYILEIKDMKSGNQIVERIIVER